MNGPSGLSRSAQGRSRAHCSSGARCRRPNIRRRPWPFPAPRNRRRCGPLRSTPAGALRGTRTLMLPMDRGRRNGGSGRRRARRSRSPADNSRRRSSAPPGRRSRQGSSARHCRSAAAAMTRACPRNPCGRRRSAAGASRRSHEAGGRNQSSAGIRGLRDNSCRVRPAARHIDADAFAFVVSVDAEKERLVFDHQRAIVRGVRNESPLPTALRQLSFRKSCGNSC